MRTPFIPEWQKKFGGKKNISKFGCPKCLENANKVGRETGDDFSSDDALGGFKTLFTLLPLLNYSEGRCFS